MKYIVIFFLAMSCMAGILKPAEMPYEQEITTPAD